MYQRSSTRLESYVAMGKARTPRKIQSSASPKLISKKWKRKAFVQDVGHRLEHGIWRRAASESQKLHGQDPQLFLRTFALHSPESNGFTCFFAEKDTVNL